MPRFLHTMIRVSDLEKSIAWYTRVLGMRLLRICDYPADEFKLAFLGFDTEKNTAVIELTWNYGEHKYTHGTGYGHICIGVESVNAQVEKFKAMGDVTIDYHSDDGFMAFIVDPDGYMVELLTEKMMMDQSEKDMAEQADKVKQITESAVAAATAGKE
eukprot:PhM_4_TR1876/c1_g1_i1/m.58064/K01759/GLO1, gloA; lactoylglutathione lyase